MAIPEQLTDVGAVNLLLASIGERPITRITDTQRLDAFRAVSTLNEVNLLVQTRGWWFNEEKNIPLTPNDDGEYDIDPDAVKVDPSDPVVDNFVKRGLRLYNTEDRTYTGNTDELKVDYVILLDFEDLPSSARLYIARRAGVIFQTRSVGSPVLFEFTDRDAQEAWGVLQEEELEHVDTNLTLAPGIVDAVHRR